MMIKLEIDTRTQLITTKLAVKLSTDGKQN